MSKKKFYRITDPMKLDVRGVFRRRMKEVRLGKSMSQADLAKLTWLAPSAVSHYETGTRSPSITNLRLIAVALNVSQGYLLGDPEGQNGKDCKVCKESLQKKINSLKW